MDYNIEDYLMYILSMEIFVLTTYFLIRMYKYERGRHSFGFAYPSPGLLFSTSVYTFFIFTGVLLWNFPNIGQDFRERFSYGTEYYLEGMLAGAISLIVSYYGFNRVYFRKHVNPSSYSIIKRIHKIILSDSSAYWLGFAITIVTVLFSQSMGELASVGYGDGNYAEKISDPKVKFVGLFIDVLSPATALMWFISFYKKDKKLITVTFIVTLGLLLFGLGRASLFGIFGYLVAVICIYAYSNMLPNNNGYARPLSISKIVVTAGILLFFALIAKSASRYLINFGVDRNVIELALNYGYLLSDPDLLSLLLSDSVSGFVKAVSGIDIVSLINTRQAEGKELQYGQTYLIILESLIPSLLYQGKPEVTLATWYGNNYWFLPSELLEYGEGVQANIFYIIGEVYINFGRYSLLMLPFIMFLYGVAIGYLCRWILRPGHMFLPMFLILTRVLHEVVMTVTTIAAVFSAVVKQIILVFVFCLLFIILLRIFKIITNSMKFRAENKPVILR